ncbi:MAG: L-threonylcarbamoyladenylate synthase [Pleurocapsa sp. MO_192.B19]|nr:L-threonylcarbamoyladenylate synthase [Pleurocapsa sp. MO_192.B19]
MVKVSQAELVAGAIAGQAVSFPTDTVPALAIKPELANQIFLLKQRPDNKPLILMGATIENLLPYIVYTPSEFKIWQKIINQYLPGALTLVLPASSLVPNVINPTKSNTVGIRIPAHAIARQILQQTGVLATSSANISGQETLTSIDQIAQVFPDVLVLDDSNLNLQDKIGSGRPSTVICWKDHKWQLLRQGSVIIE